MQLESAAPGASVGKQQRGATGAGWGHVTRASVRVMIVPHAELFSFEM